MRRACSLLFLLSFFSLSADGQVANGDFESWSGNQPDAWSTIDSGITVSPVNFPVEGGSQAAQISVDTGSQSNTDFRQTVSLRANQTYSFETSIYHTEGGVRARLYVNGYQGYSDPNLLNQWQTLSYQYTPSQNENIEVGLRFYDLSGFDGAELVYVDSFEPSTNGGGSGGSCTDHEVIVNLTTDNYGSETAWTLRNSQSQIVLQGNNLSSNTDYQETACLTDDTYTFEITDSYGDGICCSYGAGNYEIRVDGNLVAEGGEFAAQEQVVLELGDNDGGSGNPDLGEYYQDAEGLSGFPLKTALHNIIKAHSVQGYGALWGFMASHDLDVYYENDGTILDIYSEKPSAGDTFVYLAGTDQCGTYTVEGDCYNREHSVPRSWFGGKIEPMNSDVHHIFATDGYVNGRRSSYPYGEVASSSYVSSNGSKLGSGSGAYTGTVFEPVDEFKGDVARAQFYIATRYENIIAGWEENTARGDAALDGTNTTVFEPWYLALLKSWHQQDPVSPREQARNDAAQTYQGNRNPFIDHPEFVEMIWGN